MTDKRRDQQSTHRAREMHRNHLQTFTERIHVEFDASLALSFDPTIGVRYICAPGKIRNASPGNPLEFIRDLNGIGASEFRETGGTGSQCGVNPGFPVAPRPWRVASILRHFPNRACV